MERVIENAEIGEVIKLIQGLKVPKGRKIRRVLITIDPEEAVEKETPKVSKRAKMLENIAKLNISKDTGEHIRASSKEFRENFHFKHDLAEENT